MRPYPDHLPKSLEIEMEPVPLGRVQVLSRVTTEDKNDIMRVVNITGMLQQDVMRMFLMRGVRKFLAVVKASEERDQGITAILEGAPSVDNTGDYVPSSSEPIDSIEPPAEEIHDPTKG